MKQRLKSIVLSIILLFSWISFSNFPKDAQKVVADDETTTIVACSDVQPLNGVEEGKLAVESIVSQRQKDLPNGTADAFFARGDYEARAFNDHISLSYYANAIENSGRYAYR